MNRRKSRTITVVALIVLFVSGGNVFSQDMVFNSKKLNDGSYALTGTLIIHAPAEQVSALLEDFHHYSRWALKGLDGKDPVSAKHIGIFKDFKFSEKDRTIRLIYDINLFWPFGAKNRIFPLYIVSMQKKDNLLKSYTLTFTGSSPTIRSMFLKMALKKDPKGSKLTIGVTIKYSWLINPLMNEENYKESISGRIAILGNNIRDTVMRNQ